MFCSFMNLRVHEVHSGSVPDMHGQYCSILLCKLFLFIYITIMCSAHQSATHVGGGRGQGTPTSVDHVRCTLVSNPCRGGEGAGHTN